MIKKEAKTYFAVAFLLIIFCEIFVFNYPFFASRLSSGHEEKPDFEYSKSMTALEDGYYAGKPDGSLYITIKNIDKKVNYIYIDPYIKAVRNVNISDQKQIRRLLSAPMHKNSVVSVKIDCKDEGNACRYSLGERKVNINGKKSRYFRIHTYGKVKELRIVFKPERVKNRRFIFKVNDIRLNSRVPMMISPQRIIFAVLFALCIYLLYAGLHNEKSVLLKQADFKDKKQQGIIIACVVIFTALAASLPFTDVNYWKYLYVSQMQGRWCHFQYYLLAKALTQGRFDIGLNDIAKKVSEISNPYDRGLIEKAFAGQRYPWDVAYFNGKFYCYFGIIPCLIFYLPFYLLTKNPFPNIAAVSICLGVFVILSFFLIKYVVKKSFNKTSLVSFLLVYALFIASCGTMYAELRPTFYSLPQLTALDFSLGGILLWLKSADNLKLKSSAKKGTVQLIFGSLCMACVAGCRPQFLLVSLLCVPIFVPLLIKKDNDFKTGRKILNFVMFALPYMIVGAGIMYYNNARFGSPFDFGANYNLTTNDMTHRGFYLGRISQGIFVQLFQLPDLTYHFPFVQEVKFKSDYLGKTIFEPSYGGLFATNLFLVLLFLIPKEKQKLKEKGLYFSSLLLIAIALIMLVADVEMAGILVRYWMDYAWLFAFAAVLAALQLLENVRGTKREVRLSSVLCAVLIFTFAVNFFGNTGFKLPGIYDFFTVI